MSFLIRCPACHQESLDPRYSPCTCSHCGRTFEIVGFCPTCHTKLEKLQCCAINFFCNHCNSLISKRQVEFRLTEMPGDPEGAVSKSPGAS